MIFNKKVFLSQFALAFSYKIFYIEIRLHAKGNPEKTFRTGLNPMGQRIASAEQLQKIAQEMAQAKRFGQSASPATKALFQSLIPMQKMAVERLMERLN
jgi:hypothetical protein